VASGRGQFAVRSFINTTSEIYTVLVNNIILFSRYRFYCFSMMITVIVINDDDEDYDCYYDDDYNDDGDGRCVCVYYVCVVMRKKILKKCVIYSPWSRPYIFIIYKYNNNIM